MDFIAPTVPGYDVVSLLGSGSSADVWLARHRATGDSVALKRLRATSALSRECAVRELSVLGGFSHPHVVALRDVVASAEELVLVLAYAGGGSLAAVLARRTLRHGEVVTLAVPIAQALAALHARGVVHGDVSPHNILFTNVGVPMLADVGVASVLGQGPARWVQTTDAYADPSVRAGADPAPAHDVYALAAVCRQALGGAAGGGPLESILAAAMSPDVSCRPSPAELASLLWDACAAEPVRLRSAGSDGRPFWDTPPAGGDDESRTTVSPRRAVPRGPRSPARASRRRRRRLGWPSARTGRRAGVVLALLLSGLAVVAGVAWAAEGRPAPPPRPVPAAPAPVSSRAPAASPRTTTTPGPSPTVTSTAAAPAAAVAGVMVAPSASSSPAPRRLAPADWRSTLADLDRRRADALAHDDQGALDLLYAAGSPAHDRDVAMLAARRAAQITVTDMRSDLRRVTVARGTSAAVSLRVVDTLRSARAVTATGSVVPVPGRGPRTWLVTLRRVGVRWLYWDVTASRAGGSAG